MISKVLYEDNHLIAVFKPAGLLVQPDISGDFSFLDQIREYIRDKYDKKGNVFVGLVHRLDRNASGIVLFAKTSKGASRLSEQFRDHSVKKIYHALVEGSLDTNKGILMHYLLKDEKNKRAEIIENSQSEADLAELSYKVIQKGDKITLIKIDLKTGRFHQIRAQLSYIGHPILGDKKYGSKISLDDGSIALCATEIIFKKATGDEVVDIKIGMPDNWRQYLKES